MAMAARYPGTCQACGERFSAGTQIVWKKGDGSRHVECPGASVPGAAEATLQVCNESGYVPGQLLRSRHHGPVVVVRVTKHYYREDGLSFGLSDDQGTLYTGHCRPATAEETAALEAREAATLKQQGAEEDRRRRFRALQERFLLSERPSSESPVVLRGEEIDLGGGARIYGGGRWAIVEPAGERVAPSAEEMDGARSELFARKDALQTVQKTLADWTADHLPADAPFRRNNGGRAPSDGILYGDEPTIFSADDLATYQSLLSEVQRLSCIDSPDSYHDTAFRLHELEHAARLSTYPRSIWWVENNGGDGDNWSNNNIQTGGAGAIGWRLPWSEELEAQLRAATPLKGDS